MSRLVRVIDPSRGEDWPAATPPGIRRYLTALASGGAERFVANASGVRVEILRVAETVMPIAISDRRPGTASMLSPTAHHVHDPIREIARAVGRRGATSLLRLACGPLLALFRFGALDRVVYVNHWLMVGSPAPRVAPGDWPAIVRTVAARHPRHAVVVVDIHPEREPALIAALREAGGWAIPTRYVQMLDPARPVSRSVRRQHRKMRRDLARAQADRIAPDALDGQGDRLAMLYRQSNVARHSALNPVYTPAFFALALGCEQFTMQAWRAPETADTRVAGFNLQCDDGETIFWACFGAAPEPRQPSFYLLSCAADLERVEATGMIFDWGAGAGEVKRLRGGVPTWQVEVAFAAHLPLRQRIAWGALASLRALRVWLRPNPD